MKKLFPILAALVLAATACQGGSDKPTFEGIADIGQVSVPGTMSYDAVDLELPEECYVGLFLCSHEEDVVETGHFRNVVFKQ